MDGINVPIPHFGCLLKVDEFKRIQHQLELANIEFVVKPQTRYEGQIGEQLTMFVFDLSGNPIEFKTFTSESEIFSV